MNKSALLKLANYEMRLSRNGALGRAPSNPHARLVVFQSAQCKFAKPDSKWLFAVPQQNEYVRDPIPAKAIRLSDAYARVLEGVNANPKILETLEDHLRRDLLKSKKFDEQSDNWLIVSAAKKRKFHREKEVTVFFRARLYAGELLAYIRDPESGEILQLDPFDWQPISKAPFKPITIPAGLEDFADNEDSCVHNPNTLIRGAYRPVFLWKRDFEQWFNETFGHKKHPGGRPAGSGSWQDADRALIMKMNSLIKRHAAKSPNDAARLVASEAAGAGSLGSKQSRLAKGYRKLFASERN